MPSIHRKNNIGKQLINIAFSAVIKPFMPMYDPNAEKAYPEISQKPTKIAFSTLIKPFMPMYDDPSAEKPAEKAPAESKPEEVKQKVPEAALTPIIEQPTLLITHKPTVIQTKPQIDAKKEPDPNASFNMQYKAMLKQAEMIDSLHESPAY